MHGTFTLERGEHLAAIERNLIEQKLLQLYNTPVGRMRLMFKKYQAALIPPASVLQIVSADPVRKIAVMGCGDGQLANAFAMLFPQAQVTGYDRSFRAIRDAQKTLGVRPNLTFVCGVMMSEKQVERMTGAFDLIVIDNLKNSLDERAISDDMGIADQLYASWGKHLSATGNLLFRYQGAWLYHPEDTSAQDCPLSQIFP